MRCGLTGDELLQISTKLNANPKITFPDGGKPIRELTSKGIRAEIKWYFNILAETDPARWKEGLPPRALELYESMVGDRDFGNPTLFFMVPRWFVKDGYLEELTPPEWMSPDGLCSFAYFGQGVSESGTAFGETYVSRKKIAELTGMSVPSVDRIIASLVEKGHLENRNRGKNKVVRAVMFLLGVDVDDY